jgi:hypothetical protein
VRTPERAGEKAAAEATRAAKATVRMVKEWVPMWKGLRINRDLPRRGWAKASEKKVHRPAGANDAAPPILPRRNMKEK